MKMVIGDYLGRRALYSPDRTAILDAGKTPALRLSFAVLNDRANRLANWLRESAAIQPGDRVAILAHDGVEHLDCFFACGKLGAQHTPLNWRLHAKELAGILADTTPRVLIYDPEFAPIVGRLWADRRAVGLERFLCLGPGGLEPDLAYQSVLQSASGEAVETLSVEEETIAALILTGGTTGRPKAAQISHRMIAWNTLNTIIHDLHHDDTYLNVFPLFHTGGLFVYTLPQIILGGTTILTRSFDPAQVLSLIQHERVTVFAGVPTMYQMLTQAPAWAEADLSSLRFCTSGGAPLPVSLVDQYAREKGIRFKQGFGMTEFGPGLFALAAEDAIERAGSIGRPNFYVAARIVDDKNRPLPPGEVGELVLKGPSQSSGYFNNPAATASANDDEGWFHTGDLARFDAEGYYTIVDRKKDMFVSGGENVYPAEIETALHRHPAVLQCAVVGVPDPRWGEVGVACVVLKSGEQVSGAELLAHLSERLARFKIPRRIVFVAELPLSGAGKILKRQLRSRLSEAN